MLRIGGRKLNLAEDRKEGALITLGGSRFSAPEKIRIFIDED